jgi:hypothetical protein
VTFVRFVVKKSLLEWYISDELLDAERIIAAKKSETSLTKSNNPASSLANARETLQGPHPKPLPQGERGHSSNRMSSGIGGLINCSGEARVGLKNLTPKT